MQRDFNLIRRILLIIEERADAHEGTIGITFPDYDTETISYHIGLLKTAGLAKAKSNSGDDMRYWYATGLTWDGHEFVDAARNPQIWQRALDTITQKGGSITLPALLDLLRRLTNQQLHQN